MSDKDFRFDWGSPSLTGVDLLKIVLDLHCSAHYGKGAQHEFLKASCAQALHGDL